MSYHELWRDNDEDPGFGNYGFRWVHFFNKRKKKILSGRIDFSVCIRMDRQTQNLDYKTHALKLLEICLPSLRVIKSIFDFVYVVAR